MKIRILDSEGKELRCLTTEGDYDINFTLSVLKNGHFLVARDGLEKVVEYDQDGHNIWECPAANAVCATRLPNGHTLICDQKTGRLVELDTTGKAVRELKTEGRPWFVQSVR